MVIEPSLVRLAAAAGVTPALLADAAWSSAPPPDDPGHRPWLAAFALLAGPGGLRPLAAAGVARLMAPRADDGRPAPGRVMVARNDRGLVLVSWEDPRGWVRPADGRWEPKFPGEAVVATRFDLAALWRAAGWAEGGQ